MSELKFKRDTAFRKQFFVPDSFAHPAKMDAQLLIWIVERYTKPGEVILDPMAGSGTTMLACTMGRNVVLVELEGKFVKMCFGNWEIVRMHPQLGYAIGDCQIIQGDARSLEGLIDKIITSPPYAEAKSAITDKVWLREHQDEISMHSPSRHGAHQRENLHHEKLIIPDNPENIGNLPYGNIDKIITSPPYENQGQGQGKEYHPERMVGSETGLGRGYSDTPAQIGNLKGDTYLEAMLQVYIQCYKILKSGGLMIPVTKNFIRNKQEVRLDDDTQKLCEQAGFRFIERHYRKLPTQSFWRTIYKQKYPDAPVIDKEDILVFKK